VLEEKFCISEELERIINAISMELKIKNIYCIGALEPCIEVDKSDIIKIMHILKRWGFDHVVSITVVDYPPKNFIITYTVATYSNVKLMKYLVNIRIIIDRDNPKVSSIINVYPNADYLERECYEMFGIWFEGNPNMGKRFLLDPEYFKDKYPLRKDFKLS